LAIAIGCGITVPVIGSAQSSATATPMPSELAALTQGFEARDELVAREGRPALEVRFLIKPKAANPGRLIAATRAAVARLGDWHGPLPFAHLTVIDVPRGSGLAGTSRPGVIVIATPAFDSALDHAVERTLYAAVARQYWPVPPGSEPSRRWLGDGLASYVAVRGIHEELAAQHTAAALMFGGSVSWPIRPVAWSLPASDPRPRVRDFTEVDDLITAPRAEARRAALTFHTLERLLGWAATQQAVESFQRRWHSGDAGPADFAALISEQRGIDLRWFFDEAFRFEARFDYGLSNFSTELAAGTPAQYETRVSLQRSGEAVFAGTAEPRAPLLAARALKVQTRFADGTVVEDWWDGRDASLELVYAGPSPARVASVDPAAMLLLDDNRANNTRRLEAGFTEVGVRLAASWLIWLQDVMLVSSALL